MAAPRANVLFVIPNLEALFVAVPYRPLQTYSFPQRCRNDQDLFNVICVRLTTILLTNENQTVRSKLLLPSKLCGKVSSTKHFSFTVIAEPSIGLQEGIVSNVHKRKRSELTVDASWIPA